MMKRILILGCGGAGKSTLGLQLAQILQLPVFHLDSYYWKPNWEATSQEEWRVQVQNLVVEEKWIMEGNYSNTFDLRIPACDFVIYLDFPIRICLFRVFKRRWKYKNKIRPDMGKGCIEKIDWEFCKWILTFRKRNHQKILRKLKDSQKEFTVLCSPAEVTQFLSLLAKPN